METAQITADAQWEKLPAKRSVAHVKCHCAVFQHPEVAGAFTGQTGRRKTQVFCEKVL